MSPKSCWLLVVALAFAARLSYVGAQIPTPEVNARAAEAEFRLAFKNAQRLAETDPAKAIDRLQSLAAGVESNPNLAADRRTILSRIVKDRIRVLQAAPQQTPPPKPPTVAPEAVQRGESFARIKTELEEVKSLRKQGKLAEANARLIEANKRFANHVALQFESESNKITDQRQANHANRNDKEQSALAGLNDVDRSAILPKSDVQYPKDWVEKTARRRADTAPNAEELKLLKSLDTTVNAQFAKSRLEDVIDYLSTMMNLPVVLDKIALDELNLTYDSQVDFVVKKPISARAALRGVAQSLGLTYVVRDGVVMVTTPTRARNYLVTKTYYLGDFVVPIGDPFFPVGDPVQEALNVTALIQTIVTSIDPDSWEFRGGAGTIRYYAPTRSIIVRQSAEVHVSIKSSLYK